MKISVALCTFNAKKNMSTLGRKAAYIRSIWHARGWLGLMPLFGRVYRNVRRNRNYQLWLRKYDSIGEQDRFDLRNEIDHFRHRPLISIVMPVYNVEERWLRICLDSVLKQLYDKWELCIADDYSPSPHIERVLKEYAARDNRIKIIFRQENGHISAASNSALELTTGEYVALLDHDDELSEDALFWVVKEINLFPNTDMIYSDEDKIDKKGRRFYPSFKPDWSRELFYSLNLVTHFSVYRTRILKKIGGFRIGYEGSQDYDLALRFLEETAASHIRHIPRILYHWRAIRGSVALASEEKPYAHDRARKAINSHFERNHIPAKSVPGVGSLHRTIYSLPAKPPFVSIIIAADNDIAASAADILFKTVYDRWEVIVISANPTQASPTDVRVKVIESNGELRYSSLNSAAKISSGDILCFIDASTIPTSGDWLREVVCQVVQKDTGAVGVKILYPNSRIKHAGLILGIRNGVGRAHYKFHKDEPGNFMRLSVAQNFSAVSIECLTIRRETFELVGGFDVENFPMVHADVDLCLRLIETGYHNVWTPWAELIQSSNPIKSDEDELRRLRERWGNYFDGDPYYNPNLTNERDDFSLSFPPRLGKFDQ